MFSWESIKKADEPFILVVKESKKAKRFVLHVTSGNPGKFNQFYEDLCHEIRRKESRDYYVKTAPFVWRTHDPEKRNFPQKDLSNRPTQPWLSYYRSWVSEKKSFFERGNFLENFREKTPKVFLDRFRSYTHVLTSMAKQFGINVTLDENQTFKSFVVKKVLEGIKRS